MSRSARGSEVRARRFRRRRFLAGLAAAPLVLLASGLPRAQEAPPRRVLVVSRRRIMRETEAARTLRQREETLSTAFEEELESAKAALAARETELTRLRAELDPEAFSKLTEEFDRKVRTVRRRSQRRAAELQRAFRDARDALRGRIAPILIDLLRERGADIVLDAESILVAAPAVDVTEDVIARFDAEVASPALDLPEAEPLTEGLDLSPPPPGD